MINNLLKKIIILGPAYPLRGGIADFNEALAISLQREGMDVEIVSFSLQYPEFLFPGKTQYDESNPPENLVITTKLDSINPINWLITAMYLLSKKPDLIIVRFWLPFMGPCLGTVGYFIRLFSKTKIIAITDNVIPHEKRFGDKFFTRYFLGSCQAFVTMSDSVLKDLDLFGGKKPKVCTPHPVYDIFGEEAEKNESLERLGLNGGKTYLLFFGFIREYKGLDLLLRAMAEPAIRSNMNLELIIAGEFYEDEKPYLDLIEALGIGERVHLFNHFIPSNEIRYYFGAADLIVQPYKNATQSGITQIAYHFGKPMVVTCVGGLPEIVNDKVTGYVTELDSFSIAEGIAKWLKNRARIDFEQNVREAAKRFSWNGFIKELLKLEKQIH
jgi:glycosyltransferase involved in cell wall biosynthesis